MSVSVVTANPSPDQIIRHILMSRQISRSDQRYLMRSFAETSPTDDDMSLLNQVYQALRVGLLRVVD